MKDIKAQNPESEKRCERESSMLLASANVQQDNACTSEAEYATHNMVFDHAHDRIMEPQTP